MGKLSIFRRILNFLGFSNETKRLDGTIKFFDRKKRFGFIVSGTQEYFFHAAAARSEDFKRLSDNVAVTFKLVEGKKGPQADDVRLINN